MPGRGGTVKMAAGIDLHDLVTAPVMEVSTSVRREFEGNHVAWGGGRGGRRRRSWA